MARNSQNYASYTPDDFDNPPEGPVGVHRGNRAWYSVLFPYFMVIVIAAVFGFGVWATLSGNLSNIMTSFSGKQTQNYASKSSNKTESKDNSDVDGEDEDDDFGLNKDSKDSNKDNTDRNSGKDSKDNKDTSSNSSENNSQAVNKDVVVKVINATKINGYAASNADKLKKAGYTNVTASNPTGHIPSNSVVWYKDDSNKATAEDIAKTMGISAVESESDISSAIVVVLCK